jgi:hypothetical protein
MKENNKENDLMIEFEQFEQELSETAFDNKLTIIPENNTYLIDRVAIGYNTETELTQIPRIFSLDQMITDFQRVRDMMIILIESSKDMMQKIPIAIATSKASMITAISSLNNSINANGKLLIELHEKIIKMQRDMSLVNQGINPDQPNTSITNNNLVVNTKDLNQIIEDLINKKTVE